MIPQIRRQANQHISLWHRFIDTNLKLLSYFWALCRIVSYTTPPDIFIVKSWGGSIFWWDLLHILHLYSQYETHRSTLLHNMENIVCFNEARLSLMCFKIVLHIVALAQVPRSHTLTFNYQQKNTGNVLGKLSNTRKLHFARRAFQISRFGNYHRPRDSWFPVIQAGVDVQDLNFKFSSWIRLLVMLAYIKPSTSGAQPVPNFLWLFFLSRKTTPQYPFVKKKDCQN